LKRRARRGRRRDYAVHYSSQTLFEPRFDASLALASNEDSNVFRANVQRLRLRRRNRFRQVFDVQRLLRRANARDDRVVFACFDCGHEKSPLVVTPTLF
jgi:hypothetical protein